MSTTPMIAPDGTVGDVPTQNVDAAIKAGGKIGIEMVAPDGSSGVIPTDQVHEAIRAGGVVKGAPQHMQQMANQALAASGIPGGATPPAGAFISPINPAQDVQGSAGRFATAFGAQLGPRQQVSMPIVSRDASGQVRSVSFTPPPEVAPPATPMQAYQRIRSGDLAGGLGEAAGSLFRAGAPLLAGVVANAPATANLRPGAIGPSEALPSVQGQAQQLTQAINPPASEYPNLSRALTNQAGNIVDFAQRTGNSLSSNTDFANAAQGAGYETQQYLKNNFIDPVANDEVSVAGAGYKGRTVGEGQRATIGDINARIGQLNDLLRANYFLRRHGQQMSATAQDADLQAEHDSLVNILHNAVADKLRVDPADIANLRQRAGQLYSIADQTNAAVNDRLRSEASYRYGQALPKSGTELGFRIVNRLRGGQEASSSRALVDALSNTNIPVTPLPSPGGAIQGPASPAWLNYLPEDPLATARALQQAAAEQRARNRQP